MSEATKLELQSLNDFQKKLYGTIDGKDDVSSYFNVQYAKPSWNAQAQVKMQSVMEGETKEGEATIVYRVNHEYHYLMYSYMIMQFPQIRVKPEYKGKVQICWPHNLGTAPIVRAVHELDTKDIQSWDNLWANMYFQHFMKPGFRDAHNVGIGNIPAIEEWSEHLPYYETCVDQPWNYCRYPALAFPIFLCDTTSKITHKYTMKNRVSDLLRMRIKKPDGTWEELKKIAFRCLDGVAADSKINAPELWSRCAIVTQQELDFYKCKGRLDQYIEDVVAIDGPNPISIGTTIALEMKSSNPCKAYFWVAENETSNEFHNFANYTTNRDNCYRGYDPITSMSLTYGTKPRMTKMSSIHHTLMEPKFHGISPPCDVGFHMSSIAHQVNSLDIDISLVFSNPLQATLFLHINDNDPYGAEVTSGAESKIDDVLDGLLGSSAAKVVVTPNKTTAPKVNKCMFVPKLRMLVIKRMSFIRGSDGKFKFETE